MFDTNYSIIKQWKTITGEYHSTSVDKSNYDSAIGAFHSMFLPMQNDVNVSDFVFTMMDETGKRIDKCEWHRTIDVPVE